MLGTSVNRGTSLYTPPKLCSKVACPVQSAPRLRRGHCSWLHSDGSQVYPLQLALFSPHHSGKVTGSWNPPGARPGGGVIEWSHFRLFVRQQAELYEDWYRSAGLGWLDHQMDWYDTRAVDEDKVTVIILNTQACQGRKITQCPQWWESFMTVMWI